MKTNNASDIIAAGLPALDSRLGGGLRRGTLTELIGTQDLALPLAGRFVKAALTTRGKVGVFDCVHDLEKLQAPLNRLEIVQPHCVEELARHLNLFNRRGFSLVVLNLGSNVWYEGGIPRTAVDDDLRFTLIQAQAAVTSGNLVCVSVADQPIMPDGPTVVRVTGPGFEHGLTNFVVVPAIEAGGQRVR